ncbi:hypothetical protein [Undibacterium sp. KW1]|uniref:hypothetical protein n=1 Tax=Undibacterium sp. KW1 TaxID=2058624 RepID=UPI00138A1142|nr:hypothetical protein [Undibacterium sp. KW1]
MKILPPEAKPQAGPAGRTQLLIPAWQLFPALGLFQRLFQHFSDKSVSLMQI